MEQIKNELEDNFSNICIKNSDNMYVDVADKEAYIRGFNDAMHIISMGYNIYVEGNNASHN